MSLRCSVLLIAADLRTGFCGRGVTAFGPKLASSAEGRCTSIGEKSLYRSLTRFPAKRRRKVVLLPDFVNRQVADRTSSLPQVEY
jgi:hypothetical protein